MKKHQISYISLSFILLLMLSILPMISVCFTTLEDSDTQEWYMSVDGLLNSDRYYLYPYETESMDIGFSKFGEILNGYFVNLGLEYRNRDAFAPPGGSSTPQKIPKNNWQSGWLINITYFNLPQAEIRNVWACALFSDFVSAGNDWIRVDDDWLGGVAGGPLSEGQEYPDKPGFIIDNSSQFGYGGRKTNGTVVSDPIEVLYDGPRRFIARTVNHIFDWVQINITEGYNEPLLDIIITLDFNKAKKEIILIKDVVLTVEDYLIGTIDIPVYEKLPLPGIREPTYWTIITKEVQGLFVQFSDRGEWNIGSSPEFKGYVHFYTEGGENDPCAASCNEDKNTEGLATVYNDDYTICKTLPSNLMSRHGSEPSRFNDLYSTFDMAQIISDDEEIVSWSAYWPSLSDWSVDGKVLDQWWKSLMGNDLHSIDSTITEEPVRSPYLIGEWDFVLAEKPTMFGGNIKCDRQFRAVSIYGITDLNKNPSQVDWIWYPNSIEVGDGCDENMTNGYLRIDREVAFQLMDVFNPYSLVHMSSNKTFTLINVGRDSEPVDMTSLNLLKDAYISHVGKFLNVSYDLFVPNVPFLLQKFGIYEDRRGYYYNNEPFVEDFRLAMKDNWHKTIPIASSNIITVGGPIANAVTEYFNDFANVIYRGGEWFGENDFLFTSDWGATFLGCIWKSDFQSIVDGALYTDLGEARLSIVSLSSDINGTSSLVVYGYNGEDTLWISKKMFDISVPIFLDNGNGILDWTDENFNDVLDPEDSFQDDSLLGEIFINPDGELNWYFFSFMDILQYENSGITSIVILIYYDIPLSEFNQNNFPVMLIVEELGTISEKIIHPSN